MLSEAEKQIFLHSAGECCANAARLLDDARMLEFEKPKATYYFLAIIAQEEAAKAFLLYLVSIGTIPWTPFLLRATRDHQCKQLVDIILEYLAPTDEAWEREMEIWQKERKLSVFPKVVADALNILYHEKIRRWENDRWFWAEEPAYEKHAQDVADGKRDRAKQEGLYVNLGKKGQVSSLPKGISEKLADEEFERAKRFHSCVHWLTDGQANASRSDKIFDYFAAVFQQNAFIETSTEK